MKIEYKLPGDASWYILADETATGVNITSQPGSPVGTGVPVNWAPSFSLPLQEEPLALSGAQFRATLLNFKCSLPLVINVQYATRIAAMASIRAMAQIFFGVRAHLKITEGATPSTPEVQFYPNAYITKYDPMVMGATVEHHFQFESDSVTNVEPT